MKKTELIKSTYYNPQTGYVGVKKLYERLKKEGITIQDIKNVLDNQEIVQQNRKVKSGSFIPYKPLQQFQVDLIYIDDSKLNRSRYGLNCIDVFTKKLFLVLIKKRTGAEVTKAMSIILGIMGIPDSIYSDEGSEFISKEFKALLKKHNIEQILTLSHAPFVERSNRTIKEMISKYLQATNSKTLINVLPKIIQNYNSSVHSVTKYAPDDVNESNKLEVYTNILNASKQIKREPINIGDKVRVRLKSKSFEKGYIPKYSKQVYTVDDIQDNYYIIRGLKRKYLRAFLYKIGDVESPEIQPELEGTIEGHLKGLSKKPIDEESKKIVKELKDNALNNPVSTRTRKKKIDFKKLSGN